MKFMFATKEFVADVCRPNVYLFGDFESESYLVTFYQIL